ncbi:MAG: RNA methyltransferase [Bryobacteraceae bacterium]|nr:RNA methyltransferase [Bryobacteraceae bacterium]
MACKATPTWKTLTLSKVHVVLVTPRNPLNIGAVARAISNFGFESLRLVDPYRVAMDEARSAPGAGAILVSAREYATVREAIADCELAVGTASMDLRESRLPLDRLEDAAPLVRGTPGNVALLFGSEKYGLSNDDLSFCHRLVRIPTRPEHGSMNLGQAVAVCLYELIREPGTYPPAVRRQAPSGQLDRLADGLQQVLTQVEYAQVPTTLHKLRRQLRRLHLSPKDAQAVQGMLRQILWKLGSKLS